jgi:hypothetical protein
MMGATHEVISAYESAMCLARGNGNQSERAPAMKARFLSWEIIEPRGGEPNVLGSLGPVTVKFLVQVNQSVTRGHHGIALYNNERQLMWGYATDQLELGPGEHEFLYRFPMLPLRPGAYTWLVSLYDGSHDLLDALDCVPQMIVAVDPLTHPLDEWAGLLNIPAEFSVLAEARRTN